MNDDRSNVLFNPRWFRESEVLQAMIADRLKGGDGGGTSEGMSDDWKESVDRQLAQLHGDVRHLLFGLIGGFLILGGAGWTAYAKLSDQITEQRVEQAKSAGEIEGRITKMDGKLDLLLDQRTAPAKR